MHGGNAGVAVTELVSIHMACNDPENGDFVGRVCQMDIASGCLELTARAWNILSFRRCPKLREESRVFFLAGKRWSFVRRKSWIGNWCWDGYAVEPAVATAFLTWLHGRDLYQCEGGWVETAEAWDRPAPLVLPERWWVA